MSVNKTDRDHNILISLSHPMILTIFISLPTVRYEFCNFISILFARRESRWMRLERSEIPLTGISFVAEGSR